MGQVAELIQNITQIEYTQHQPMGKHLILTQDIWQITYISVIDADKKGCEIESRAEYSEFLEFGTSKMQPRPFLQPALESKRQKIKSLFRRLKARGA